MVHVFRALLFLILAACAGGEGSRETWRPGALDTVGRKGEGRAMTPVNQVLVPHGVLVDLPGLRPQAVALSRDGRHVYVSGKTAELLVLDAETGSVVRRVALPGDPPAGVEKGAVSDHILEPDKRGQLSYTGLVVSRDGSRIYMSNVRGSIKIFAVDGEGRVEPSHSWILPPANAPGRKSEIPSGLALDEKGGRLLVCGNLSNRLLVLDLEDGRVLRTFDVGVAPHDVVLVRGRAFVSNRGGRRPGPEDPTGPAGRGTRVRVDPVRHVASEGSVSIVDLQSGKVREIVTGRHACGLAVAPDGRHVVCANAGSDHLSLIEVQSGRVIDTIWARPSPSHLLGATPNALVFDPSGERLYVANGTRNAVGVVAFEPEERGESKLVGEIPVGWFPGALAFDRFRDRLVVANVKGIGFGRRRKDGRVEFNTHQYHGSVSLVPLPDRRELRRLSARVDAALRRPLIEEALKPPRPHVPPRAVPERIGEPSRIRHVVYIIKENRTYDQILGDMPEGDGDPSLCIFGEDVTPNQHALAREFVLLDNTYCAGILSADGHNWSTAAFANDYLEKSFAGWPRSYPDGMTARDKDALAWSSAGFIWDHALARGLSIRNYGEFCEPFVRWKDASRKGRPDFMACFRTWRGESDEVIFESRPVLPSLEPFSPRGYVGWSMEVPDQYRADFIIREVAAFEQQGEFPNLVIICLPNDHTSGTAAGKPTPAACVADGDLAFGRIVEALTHSSFWPRMAILAIEDDPQAGWDHVSAYRTTAFVISPFARRGARVRTRYNTTSVLRTIEQILGIPPMNVFDASATPMWDCFQETPDLRPYTALPNRVPLDRLNPPPKAIAHPRLREDALASARLDLRAPDRAPEDLLNRILWRSRRGPDVPYPEHATHPGAEEDDEKEAAGDARR